MKNVSHNEKWNVGTVKLHVNLPLFALIKSKNVNKSDKYFVIIKLRRDMVSHKLDLYGFKMALFHNSKP